MLSRILTLAFATLFAHATFAQGEPEGLPRFLTEDEVQRALQEGYIRPAGRGIETPPNFGNLRAAAEWEEIQALTIAWRSYFGILKEIVHAAVNEVEVIILTENPGNTESFLLNNDWGGPVDMTNVTLIQTGLNSIWIRDYGANTIYGNEVDDLFLTDWIYNRPRPQDDVSPEAVANYLGLDLYATTAAPYDLMNTGGNYMSDGFGQAFASRLVVNENDGGNTGWGTQYPNHTEAEIDNIMNLFMGTDPYIKMTVLPFDGINHIDMHMKLVDEETIVVSEYPEGVADGPQIEANIQYIQDNFTTKYGNPYKIVRIPAPPQQSNGSYPDAGGHYLTYTNAVFVNKTIIVPTYYEQYDTTALRIWQETMPGYNIVGIDCDNSGQNIISAGGAIHCITQSVGVEDPLLISYECLPDTDNDQTPYSLQAYINHRSGISGANLFYTTDLEQAYTPIAMVNTDGNNWSADIPAQAFGSTVYYYVEATAVSGKVMARPMTAPEGYKSFRVIDEVFGCTDPAACNYNPLALIDDNTCEQAGCTNPSACNFDPLAACDDGSCATESLTLTLSTDCWGGEVSWTITDDSNNVLASAPEGTYGNQQTYTWEGCLPAGCYSFNIFDGYGDGMFGSQYGSCSVDGDYSMIDGNGNILFAMGNPDYGNGTTEAFCLVASTVLGCTNPLACNFNPLATEDDNSCLLPDGCTDAGACNYNPAASCDDNSCEYLTCLGCTDATACNYNSEALIEDGSCSFSQNWWVDSDGDGYGDPNLEVAFCDPPGNGYALNSADCDDSNPLVYLGAQGTGEGIDNNCNGIIDPTEELPTPCLGDFDNNGLINSSDVLVVLGAFGCSSNCAPDLDGDGLITSSDILIIFSLFGTFCD